VPSNCWKVVVVLPVGSNDVSRTTSSTRVIAVNTHNSNCRSRCPKVSRWCYKR
jgi:endonuclease G